MAQSLQEMLPKLRCPISHTPLHVEEDKLVSDAGDVFPLINGKPVLVKHITEVHVTAPSTEIISQNIQIFYVPGFIDGPEKQILHLGSGNVLCTDPRVISIDILPCENVDLVSEAEELPFLDNTFDYVESGAVFEHLYDPLKAISEVRRILKPNGLFRIDTAFLQTYHGYPSHYFNMTPQAIETFLVDDFILEQSSVPDSATPIKTLIDFIDRFLYYQPGPRREDLLAKPLGELLAMLKADITRNNPLLSDFEEFQMWGMAASYVVIGRKPMNYEALVSRRMREGQKAVDEWLALKRNYYTSRVAVMYRHQEARVWKRWCQETGLPDIGIPEPEPLDLILNNCKANGLLDPVVIQNSIDCLKSEEAKLAIIRNQWIDFYNGRLVNIFGNKLNINRNGSSNNLFINRVIRKYFKKLYFLIKRILSIYSSGSH